MNEKKGPFDAAIRILSDFSDYRIGTIGEVKGKSCVIAIRVLEAAGKVDKEACIAEWELLYQNKHTIIGGQVRTLLKALPDPEEER